MKEKQPIQEIDIEPAEFPSGCRPATARHALFVWGIIRSEIDLWVEMGATKKDGATLESLREILWKEGVTTIERAGMTWDELKMWRNDNPEPIIVCWWDERQNGETPDKPAPHDSLVKSVDEDRIELYDPGQGEVVPYSREKWMKIWKNSENPDDPDEPNDRHWAMMLKIFEVNKTT